MTFKYADIIREEGYALVANKIEKIYEALHGVAKYIDFLPDYLGLSLGMPDIVVAEGFVYQHMELRILFKDISKGATFIDSGSVVFEVGYGKDSPRLERHNLHPHMRTWRCDVNVHVMCISSTWYHEVSNAFEIEDWKSMFYESIAAASTYNPGDAYRQIPVYRGRHRDLSCRNCGGVLANFGDQMYAPYDEAPRCDACRVLCGNCNNIIGNRPPRVLSGENPICRPCFNEERAAARAARNEEAREQVEWPDSTYDSTSSTTGDW